MRILILIFLLMSTSSFAARGKKENTSWSFLFGQGEYVEGRKKTNDIAPDGAVYKLIYGSRKNYWEFGASFRYAHLSDEIKIGAKDGELSHNDMAVGLQAGFWAFSWLQLHVGYAKHYSYEDLSGDFTDQEKETFKETYNVSNKNTAGLYTGVDLVLLQSNSVQFFLNYDYYHINSQKAREWEAMAGLRFYVTPSKSESKTNWFKKMFDSMFSKD